MASRRGAALLLRGAAGALQTAAGRQAQQLAAMASSEACSTGSIRAACSASYVRPALHRGFAASAAGSLAEILKAESTYEKENYQRPPEIASGPPAPFKLTESPGDTLLTLSRSFNAETVNVDLHVNNQPSPPYEGEGGEEGGEDDKLSSVVFNVSVAKGEKSLVFECESDGNSVTISHVSFEPKDGFDSESMYTGPVFDELDEELQARFQSYLAERGVTGELGEYLRFLIYDKEQREYQAWLDETHDFVAK